MSNCTLAFVFNKALWGVGGLAEERRQWAARIAVIAVIAVIVRDRKSKTVNHKGHEGTVVS